jgi:formylglycine-generating enzyme required for sulfatase activity
MAPIRIPFFLFFSILPLFASDSLSLPGLDMLLIPGGSFSMGSNDGQRDEQPVHTVHIDSFYLNAAEVTVWEYLRCVQAGECRMPVWWNKRFYEDKADDKPGRTWLALPVTGISWDDALTYCKWLGPGFRLPTEAEWEYAARAGSTGAYFWGNSKDSERYFAVVDHGLSPAGSRKPNDFGLYDMIGNAWEWCGDRYDKKYYQESPAHDPQGPVDAKRYPYRVVRGGGWNEYSWNLRCSNRNYGEPFRRYDGVGFRVCRSIKAP